ncbi:MAG: Holliday junction resolvase RuvX, partial [Erysipelotrichaceae bacterium]
MERILGLDLGSRTLGVAVSDAMGMFARPVKTLRFEDDDYEHALELLQELLDEFSCKKVVLGLPKHMNGDIGIRGEISLDFKKSLEDIGVEVVLWDERLTTVAATKLLISADVSRKKRKQVVDQLAAVNILQAYLD